MKKVFFSLIALALTFLFVSPLAAQNNPSRANRSRAALNSCIHNYLSNNFWEVKVTLSSVGTCADGPASSGVRETYIVYAEPKCRPGEPCPLVASIALGEVVWCSGEIESVTCNVGN